MAVSGLSVMNDVKLIVKTPNQRIGDVHVSCEIDWTVQRLKEHLSSVYPTKPCKTMQRLIYGGRLLQDHLTLTDILSKDNDSHTVHIVCSITGNEIEVSADDASSSHATAHEVSSPNVTAVPTNANNIPQTAGNGSSVRRRFPTDASPIPNMNQSFQSNSTPPINQIQASHQWQQYMQSMQQYWNAYYQQQQQMAAMYHQNANPSYFGSMPFTPMHNNATFSPPPMMPQVPTGPIPDLTNGANQPTPELNQQPAANAQPQVEQQPEVRQPVPAAAAPQNLPRLNAGGAMFDDDEEEEGGGRQRDWLDWIYTFLRCGVLLSVMYFYSSASRLVLVLLLGFIVYLYQNGWFSLPQRQPQPQQQQQGQDNQFVEQNEHENPGGDDEDNNNNGEVPLQDQQNVNRGTNFIANTKSTVTLLFTFVSSFFTSLIPQRPPPLQI